MTNGATTNSDDDNDDYDSDESNNKQSEKKQTNTHRIPFEFCLCPLFALFPFTFLSISHNVFYV